MTDHNILTNSPRPTSLEQDHKVWDSVGIRDLLDLKGTEEEISQFEEEFEDAVYQDVIEITMLEDVPEEETESFAAMFDADYPSDEALQDAVVARLKELIPDVEARLLARVREAKAEAFASRLTGLREFHQNKPENIATLDKAQSDIEQGRVAEAVAAVNALAT